MWGGGSVQYCVLVCSIVYYSLLFFVYVLWGGCLGHVLGHALCPVLGQVLGHVFCHDPGHVLGHVLVHVLDHARAMSRAMYWVLSGPCPQLSAIWFFTLATIHHSEAQSV